MIPALVVDAADTIGAGDAFMASMIHSVLEYGSRGLERRVLERIGIGIRKGISMICSLLRR